MERQESVPNPDFAALLELDLAGLSYEDVFQAVRNNVAGQPLPSRSREDGPDNSWIDQEKYSNSGRMRRVLREALIDAVRQGVTSLEDLPLEAKVAIVSQRRRRETSIIEAIQTYPDLRAIFQLNNEDAYLVRDGHIVFLDGVTKMTSSLDRGAEKARQEAETNPLMVPIERRTAADRRFIEGVQRLEVGQSCIGPSAYEDSADELFMRSIGWHRGLSFWQGATRVSENIVRLFSYSVDPAPSEAIRRVWQQKSGMAIPEHITADTWQDFSLKFQGDADACRQMLLDLRAACYKETGDTRKRFVLEEVFALNNAASKEIFNKLFMRITLGVKDEIVQSFAGSLLDDPDALDQEIYARLVGIYNRDHLTESDADLLEHLVRYAEAKHYCKALRAVAASGSLAVRAAMVPNFHPVDIVSLQAMARRLSLTALEGIRDNDIFGGCLAVINFGNRNKPKQKNSNSKRDDTVGELDDDFEYQSSAESSGACDYDNPYCYCCPYNDDGSLRDKPLVPRARREANGDAHCLRWACCAKIDANGIVTSKGKVYERAQQLTLAERKLKPLVMIGLAQKVDQAKKRRESSSPPVEDAARVLKPSPITAPAKTPSKHKELASIK